MEGVRHGFVTGAKKSFDSPPRQAVSRSVHEGAARMRRQVHSNSVWAIGAECHAFAMFPLHTASISSKSFGEISVELFRCSLVCSKRFFEENCLTDVKRAPSSLAGPSRTHLYSDISTTACVLVAIFHRKAYDAEAHVIQKFGRERARFTGGRKRITLLSQLHYRYTDGMFYIRGLQLQPAATRGVVYGP